MVLKNHLAYKFLENEDMSVDMIRAFMPEQLDKFLNGQELTETEKSQLKTISATLSPDDQDAFYITHTILEKVDMLKVKKQDNGHYDWSVFDHLEKQKKTFIFPDNYLIRLYISSGYLGFCYIDTVPAPEHPGHRQVIFHLFHYHQDEKRFSSNWDQDVGELEEQIYKLFCFFYLSENDFIVVEPGRKHGTRKEGKLINSLDVPVTIVNSNWNITSIRTEGFGVRGHFAIRWSGKGRSIPKMVFIKPFKKKGYVRKAKKDQHV